MYKSACNLVPVRDRPIDPYIFEIGMKRRVQNSVDNQNKIQISNGQKFKFSTVKKNLVVNTGEKFSKYFINTPQLLRSPYLINPKSQPRQNMVWGSLSSRMIPWCVVDNINYNRIYLYVLYLIQYCNIIIINVYQTLFGL